MSGRGAWPNSGTGGTRDTTGQRPGPYYVNTGAPPYVGGYGGWKSTDLSRRAVHGGVLAIQNALAHAGISGVDTNGLYGAQTEQGIWTFQRRLADPNITPWGGVGRETSKALFLPWLKAIVTQVNWTVVCGLIENESAWDPGAVGYVDPTDLGLAQINGPNHPDLTERQRFDPAVAFAFVQTYIVNALKALGGNMRDAIASYNLGLGGADAWIKAGRPDVWNGRDVKAYIDRIEGACQ